MHIGRLKHVHSNCFITVIQVWFVCLCGVRGIGGCLVVCGFFGMYGRSCLIFLFVWGFL